MNLQEVIEHNKRFPVPGFVRSKHGNLVAGSVEEPHSGEAGKADKPAEQATPRRLRQSSKPLMNKLETQFHNRLMYLYPGNDFHPQAKRFKLGNGIWFKPDFTASGKNFSQEVAWEVKGPHAFRGGFENLKVAAGLWPEVKWILVWKDGGEWRQQTVLP